MAGRNDQRGRRALWLTIWILAVLLLGEGALRTAGFVLRRDGAFGVPRPGAQVIYCVGDSFTYGQGVEEEEAWPRVLGSLLRERAAADPLEVRPLAEPGMSSTVATWRMSEALKAGDARLVLVLTGWNANDGDFAAHAARRNQPVFWASRIDIWLGRSRLYRVTKQAVTYRSRTLLLDQIEIIPQTTAMSLYDFRAYQEIALENLRQIARMCHAAEVPCALLTYPHQLLPPNPYTRIEYYHALFGRSPVSDSDYVIRDRRAGEIAIDAVIRHVGATEDVPVIDLQPAFERAGRSGLFLPDFHHPTAAGHELIAHAVLDAIEPGLDGRRAEPQ